MRIHCFVLGLIVSVLPAGANSLQINGSDSETGLFSQVSYEFRTNGNGGINSGQTGFTPTNGQSTLQTLTGIVYSNYLSSLPSGATLTDATLDFAGLFSNMVVSSPLSGGTFFYQPTFSELLGGYTVHITSTLSAGANLSGSSATAFDLWPAFQADLLAGNAIHVNWSAPDTFSADHTTYNGNCNSCNETFTVKDAASFSASSSENDLTLIFTRVSTAAVPEPGSMPLMGLGLVATSVFWRRTKSSN